MQSNPEHPRVRDFLGLLPHVVDAVVVEAGWPKFRGQQLREWVYSRQVVDAAAMTNFSKVDRQRLPEVFQFATGTITRKEVSEDGTIKLLITWPDGSNAETVMIPDGDRRTACVSSQVGCPVGCKFCASGLEGVKGNLSAAQIVEQIWHLNRVMAEGPRLSVQGSEPASHPERSEGAIEQEPHARRTAFDAATSAPRITNVVFMGMGEPMSNYAPVMQAVRIMHDPKCFNLGARRITISTVGVPPRIRQLAGESLPLNLALSLHAPNEPLRKQLIPWADHFALPEILDACRYYFAETGREITLEYILLSGVNDRPEHARELARLCKTMRANVNLIRYNEVESLPFKRPVARDVVTFQEILRKAGVNAHVRKSRGRDIAAACGQLRRKEARERLVQLSNPLPVLPASGKSGFTMIELLVVIGIIVILASIFVPYALRLREDNRRIACRDRLQQVFKAMQSYAADHGSYFPTAPGDTLQPLVAFMDQSDRPNNVTASLWLLVKQGYSKNTSIFLCPSVGGGEAPVDPRRTDFWSAGELGFSYASPFGQTESYRLTDTLKPAFALMADANPGNAADVPADAPLLRLSTINSANHQRAGQNVLYAYGSVEWQITPYCGMNNDNIYTVRGERGATQPTILPAKDRGSTDPSILPSAEDDSFLFPMKR